MHRHTADQAFYGLQGECFINFPDGTRQSITPGVLVVIPKGQYYQQEAPSHTAMFSWAAGRKPMPILASVPKARKSRPAVPRRRISERSSRSK